MVVVVVVVVVCVWGGGDLSYQPLIRSLNYSASLISRIYIYEGSDILQIFRSIQFENNCRQSLLHVLNQEFGLEIA